MGNRPLGGYVFGERSKPKTEGAEYVLIYQIAQTFGVLVLPMRVGDPVVGEYADVTARRSVTHLTLLPGGRLPTLRSPMLFTPHFVGSKLPSLT
ncbi:MAG: hypothetical protein LBQ66_01825 [Planctomycetaceae bacterium]|nr:hypothetical protein [Planctomycetaceae bacterium]